MGSCRDQEHRWGWKLLGIAWKINEQSKPSNTQMAWIKEPTNCSGGKIVFGGGSGELKERHRNTSNRNQCQTELLRLYLALPTQFAGEGRWWANDTHSNEVKGKHKTAHVQQDSNIAWKTSSFLPSSPWFLWKTNHTSEYSPPVAQSRYPVLNCIRNLPLTITQWNPILMKEAMCILLLTCRASVSR